MKTQKNILKALVVVLLFAATQASAQCPNNNTQYGTSNAPTTIGTTVTLSTCMYGGEYRLVNNMIAGSQYSFETCGDTDFDTQITVYDNSTGAVVAYNDDFCGLQSKVTFTSNGNSVRVLIDKYYCTNQSSCMTLKVTRVSGASSVNPCNSVVSLNCGVTATATLSGSGVWNPSGPWGTPGAEQVFSFTAPFTGTFPIAVTNAGYYVDLFFKTGSCSSSGWTYVSDIYSSSNFVGNFVQGQTYLILIDDENTATSNISITVSCPPPAADPCTSVTSITSCGSAASFNLSAGNGAWNPPGPWGTPGNEAVFSFTPTISGAYPITVTNSGYYVDLFYKTGSCSSSGWTYVSDIYTNETNTVNLTAGVTYLFLIDDENTSASSGTITIGCPCIPPPGGIDGSYTYNGDFVISGTTIGACNDCSLRPSNDRVYEVIIPCASTYSFTTCGGASWDTYLYLRTAACGGSSIAINDDACGLQSRVTAYLQPGTYYIHVEGWSANSQGAFNLSVSNAAACNLLVGLSADVKRCGYNISCNGSSDGSITASSNGCNVSYAWSNGATGPVVNGLSAGTYTVVATDLFGCTSSASVTLTEPDPLVVDAGANQVVYYGYAPMACADLSGSATGGCAAYSYAWSSGDNTAASTVCPQVTTDYTLVVTDDNGCTASDDVTVCAVNVICYAGNSGNQKVEMCHIPHGNPSNAHTICINASAVPAHLAHGCVLGDCGELASVCGQSSMRIANFSDDETLPAISIKAVPNPFSDNLSVSVTFPEKGDYFLVLLDVHGRIVKNIYSGQFDAMENRMIDVNTDNLAQGVYILSASDGSGFIGETQMIVKK
jgi:hypothetical protein